MSPLPLFKFIQLDGHIMVSKIIKLVSEQVLVAHFKQSRVERIANPLNIKFDEKSRYQYMIRHHKGNCAIPTD